MRSHHSQRHRRRVRRIYLARSIQICPLRCAFALLLGASCLLSAKHISVEAADDSTSHHKSNESSPHEFLPANKRRHLQPSFLVAECSVPEDPDAYFYTKSRGTLRRCKWLAKDRFRMAEECSTAEAVSRTGVVAITDADWNCPHTCGKCDVIGEEDLSVPIDGGDELEEEGGEQERVSDDSYSGIGADLADALGLDGSNASPQDTGIDPFDNLADEDDENAAVETDFGLSGNIVVIEPNEDDVDDHGEDIFEQDEEDGEVEEEEEEEEVLLELPMQQQPETQPYQEIKINILDPSGMGLKDDPVIGILPRRGRTWQDVALSIEQLTPPDPMQVRGSEAAVERDPFKFTEMPSVMPSATPTTMPSASPSAAPTALPSVNPSAMPTSTPSTSPTDVPSASPTPAPSATPSISTPEPTHDPWRGSEPTPSNAPSAYFNYNPWKSRGIKDWSDVQDPPEENYWKEFDEYISLSLDNNKCNSNSRRQSPIDVRFDKANGQCFEYHQIRSKPGEYSIEQSIVEKQILPSKLRFIYPFSFDKTAAWATSNDSIKGPSADMPKGWGPQLPVTHVDIKVPSEHWMEGKQYIAEYQIFLIQNRDKQRGSPAVSVLFDIHPQSEKNKRFQILLDAFQDVYDRDMAQCRARRRRQRRLGALFGKRRETEDDDLDANRSTWLDEPREENDRFQRTLREAERRTQDIRKFNPWTSDIVRTLYFFGYEGSLTEPPCTEFVEWRILDTPALISRKQYWQLRVLLFDHVDKNCKKTSVHYQGSVARPLQNYNGRLVHRCMCRDFLGDRERSELGINRCPWKDRDQWGFNRQQYSLDWYEKTHRYNEPKEQPLTDWASF